MLYVLDRSYCWIHVIGTVKDVQVEDSKKLGGGPQNSLTLELSKMDNDQSVNDWLRELELLARHSALGEGAQEFVKPWTSDSLIFNRKDFTDYPGTPLWVLNTKGHRKDISKFKRDETVDATIQSIQKGSQVRAIASAQVYYRLLGQSSVTGLRLVCCQD